jgi:predicted ribosome quality control (RQC) complex YloA/Tae2 family protein
MKTQVVYFDNIKKEITYLIGENAADNFVVIDASDNPKTDIWFHAREGSSCHVVAKIPGEQQLNKKELLTICKKGGLLCKLNTPKLKKQKNVEIIYTKIGNVTKTNIDGLVHTTETKTKTLHLFTF